MGYFANGFVFTAEPNFAAVPPVLPGRSIRGYKHNHRDLWLLDVWKSRGRLRRHAPFCEPAAEDFIADHSSFDDPTQQFLTTFQQVITTCEPGAGSDEVSINQMALVIAAAARRPTYFFAADDEELDLGGRADPKALLSFSCRLCRTSVRYDRGRVEVTPLSYGEDELDVQAFADCMKALPQVILHPSRDMGDGPLLYENPVEQWPQEAGDPTAILGFGTWDPLLNVESDFHVVFESLV